MRGYILVAFWQRWACCPLYARLYLDGFLVEVGMLSSICEGILGWLFAEVGMLSAICDGILGWLYGRGGHACCPQYARLY